jgi:hypothetical protein
MHVLRLRVTGEPIMTSVFDYGKNILTTSAPSFAGLDLSSPHRFSAVY